MAQVRVSEGVLEGELVKNDYGGEFYSFKGIPYATPPVGDLRFKAPQPPQPWTGVRSATQFGPICCQIDFKTFKKNPESSEDCLYLNVYTPEIKPEKSLPVIVWIHGGGFKNESGNDSFYGPELLIRQNVIIVTLNYRLEVLGFLCLGTEDIPGNAGMKDQVAALRWVKKNIENFGGDPENITIYGESAGGASVSFHLISPMTKGLFKRAIQASGSANTPWAFQERPRERALALARKLGCYSEDDKELYEFFKSVPGEKLIEQKAPLSYAEAGGKMLVYYSVVDEKQFGDNERFWYGDVNTTLREKGIHPGVELMTGYTEDEGIYFLLLEVDKMINNANKFYEFYVPPEIASKTTLSEQIEIGKKIRKRFVGDSEVTKDTVFGIMDMYGMDTFKLPTIQFAKAASRRNKVYLYNFKCLSDLNLMVTIMNVESLVKKPVACHGDDLPYIFLHKTVKAQVPEDLMELINMYTKVWSNFAKFGNPTPDNSYGVQWQPFTPENQDFMEAGNTLVPAQFPEKETVEFYEEIYRKYHPEYLQ